MQIALVEMQRRVQARVPLPWMQTDPEWLGRAACGRPSGRPLRGHPARLDRLPADAAPDRRHPAPVRRARARRSRADSSRSAATATRSSRRDAVVRRHLGRRWQRTPHARRDRRCRRPASIRCWCSRCARFSRAAPRRCMQRLDLPPWTHGHCPFCGWEPDFAVITPSAERRLICGRCVAQWAFDPLTCPFCANDDRALHHVVRDARRPVPRLRVRRLPPLSEGVRRPPRDAARSWWRWIRSPRCRSTRPPCSADIRAERNASGDRRADRTARERAG